MKTIQDILMKRHTNIIRQRRENKNSNSSLYVLVICLEPCKMAVSDKIVLELYLENNLRGLDETSYNHLAAEEDVESTRTISTQFWS